MKYTFVIQIDEYMKWPVVIKSHLLVIAGHELLILSHISRLAQTGACG